MKIVADQHIPFVEQYFSQAGELCLLPGRAITSRDLQDAEMLLVRSVTHVTQDLLQASKIKFVGSVTAGADHLDLTWLTQAGIQVRLASGFNAPPVADYVVSVIAALQSTGHLPRQSLRTGVIGVGQVGRCVIERLSALNHTIVMSDPPRTEQEPDFYSHSLEEFCDLDVVTLHVPLTRGSHATHHFVNDTFLQRLKPGCVLINASRGAVIDTAALLRSGRHLQWCFDVWAGEPRVNQDVLAQALIATPHIAGYSVQSKRRGVAMIYQAACEAGFIHAGVGGQWQLPATILNAEGQQVTWQWLALQLFDPLQMTRAMRLLLSTHQNSAQLFDEMRLNFNDRHELSCVILENAVLSAQDADILRLFGVKLQNCRLI